MFIHEYGSKEDPLVLLLAPMMVSGEDLYRLMHPYLFFASANSRKVQTKMANLASPFWRKLQAARQGCLGAAEAALQTYF